MQNWKVLLQYNRFYIILTALTIFLVVFAFITPRNSIYEEGITTIEGKVIAYKIDGNFLSMTVESKEKVQAFYYFQTEEEKLNYQKHLEYGVTIRIEGILEKPESNSLPNTFNYQKSLYYQKIHYILNVNQLEIIKPATGIYFLKNWIYQRLYHLEQGDYLVAMILGNTSHLNIQDVKTNGISHLFAVSGMQITLLAKVIASLLKRFGTKKDAGILLFLWFYAFLVGFTPSVMRAVLSWCYQWLNKKGQWNLNKTQIFLLILCTILLVQPFAIMNLGFQYSFLISFVLMRMKFSKNYIKSCLEISIVSFLASLPITAMNFYSINILSVLWNLFFVPIVTFVLFPLCFLYILFPFLKDIFVGCITLFEITNQWCANISFGIITIPKVSMLWWGIYYLLLGCVFQFQKRTCFLFIIILLIIIKYQCKLTNHAYVYFLDVGQGDATLFVAPHQKEVILLDTGGKITYQQESWKIREQQIDQADSIKTFLNSIGISSIDTLILSHGDTDHAGNAMSLLEKMSIHNIIMNRNTKNTLEQKIENLYPSKIKSNISSSSFQISDFTIAAATNENDASLVLQISIYNQSFLMTGDISQKIEEKLLTKEITSTILKVAHHGSKNSSNESFLKTVAPTYAIIHVGKDNRYNHPAKETLAKLDKLGISYLMTSNKKTIWFEISPSWMKLFYITS